MTQSRSIDLQNLRDFLLSRDWRLESGDRFDRYIPPSGLGLDSEFFLTVPRTTEAPDVQKLLSRIADTVADLYSVSEDQIRPVLADADTVLAIRLEDEQTASGSIPFTRFEGMMEKLGKVLLDAAAFVVNDDPVIDKIPPEAQVYLGLCNFLQTEAGSFVAKVQLPSHQVLRGRSLFEDQLPAAAVTERLESVLSFVLGPVFHGSSEIFSEKHLRENMELVNVDLLGDIKDFLVRASSKAVSFSFLSTKKTTFVSSGVLTSGKTDNLSNYISFVRSSVADNFVVNVEGRIVELRSRNPQSNRNYIVVQGIVDGQINFVAVTLNNDLYAVAIQAHRSNRRVKLRGLARRMKTQIKITDLEFFMPVD